MMIWMTVMTFGPFIEHQLTSVCASDLYGDSAYTHQLSANGHIFGKTSSSEAATVLRLTLRDALPAWGSIADMVFSVSKDGVRIETSVGIYTYLTSRISHLGPASSRACGLHRCLWYLRLHSFPGMSFFGLKCFSLRSS